MPIDFPREVLELPSNGARGWRRIVHNADELERYWRGKSGSVMYTLLLMVTLKQKHLNTIEWTTTHH